jgi:hypothetical protein
MLSPVGVRQTMNPPTLQHPYYVALLIPTFRLCTVTPHHDRFQEPRESTPIPFSCIAMIGADQAPAVQTR